MEGKCLVAAFADEFAATRAREVVEHASVSQRSDWKGMEFTSRKHAANFYNRLESEPRDIPEVIKLGLALDEIDEVPKDRGH